MKILFLGGTGNISAVCAAWLHEHGHDIAVVSRGGIPVPAFYQAITADRRDAGALHDRLKGVTPDVVLNFLGYELNDVQLDFGLFKDAVSQYIFISSTTVYARPPAQLPMTEQAPLGNAYWEYARKKLQCEQWLMQQRQEHGFPVTVVRPSHTYSHRWIPNPVSSASYTFAARLEQGLPVFVPDQGENPWTLTSAQDFAAGLGGLVGNPLAIGEAFHITSDEVLSWNQIVTEIAGALGVSDPHVVKIPTDFICQIAPQMTGSLKGDKAHPGIFDNTKIKSFVPTFHCKTPFRIGVRASVAWLRQHPEYQNRKPEVDALCDQVVAAWRSNLTS